MRNALLFCLISLAMAGLTPAAADPANGLLRVCKTNIFCVKAPCPWRGIAPAEARDTGPAGLIWRRTVLPEIVGAPADARRIAEAWTRDDCVLIEGRLVRSVLHVERVAGPCL